MTRETITRLAQPDGVAIYRHDHQKGDGRRLCLYGYEKPSGAHFDACLEGAGPGAELRWHPLLQEWSIYAAHRQNRTFMPSAAEDPLAPMTADGPVTEIDVADFELAIFQNRFASLHPASVMPTPAPAETTVAAANGDCEVVVYTPEATGSLATLTQERRRLLIAAWIDRYAFHDAEGVAFTMPFESRGREVGVTLDHPHGQIYAFPFVPQVQQRAMKAYDDGFTLHHHLKNWRTEYLIEEAGPLMAVTPPFARFPYEAWIVSQTPVRGPWEFDTEALDAYAYLLGRLTERYDALFQRPAATMMSLQAAPRGASSAFQFTTQFYPILRAPDKVKFLASVEQSTAVFTVDVMPESAAHALRNAL